MSLTSAQVSEVSAYALPTNGNEFIQAVNVRTVVNALLDGGLRAENIASQDQIAALTSGALIQASSLQVYRPATNNTAGFQAAINAAIAKPTYDIELPGGVTSVGTLTAQNGRNVHMRGQGYGQNYLLDNDTSGTTLLYAGADGGDLLQVKGVSDLSLGLMVLSGKHLTDRTQTNVLLHLIKTTGGIATGNFRIQETSFQHAVYGIKCGDLSNDTNCADITFDTVLFKDLTYGLYAATDQALNFVGQYFQAVSCDYAVYLERGGSLDLAMLNGSFAKNCVALGRGGPNVGNVRIGSLRMEPPSGGGAQPRIIYVEPSLGAYSTLYTVEVGCFCIPVNTNPTGFANELHNGVRVHFHDGIINNKNFANITSNSTARRTRVNVTYCSFPETNPVLSDYFTVDGNSVLVVDNCCDSAGNLVTNQ